jgi:hypothetical protein
MHKILDKIEPHIPGEHQPGKGNDLYSHLRLTLTHRKMEQPSRLQEHLIIPATGIVKRIALGQPADRQLAKPIRFMVESKLHAKGTQVVRILGKTERYAVIEHD